MGVFVAVAAALVVTVGRLVGGRVCGRRRRVSGHSRPSGACPARRPIVVSPAASLRLNREVQMCADQLLCCNWLLRDLVRVFPGFRFWQGMRSFRMIVHWLMLQIGAVFQEVYLVVLWRVHMFGCV